MLAAAARMVLQPQAVATCLDVAISDTFAMNSVLSILPWKIGTPSSMHFSMTSRRSIPASRASSVGVRWIAIDAIPPDEVCHVDGTVACSPDVHNGQRVNPG